jgi:hypothetical protein
MTGFIRKREVILNAATVIRGFGWRVFLHCLTARANQTFLEIATHESSNPAVNGALRRFELVAQRAPYPFGPGPQAPFDSHV